MAAASYSFVTDTVFVRGIPSDTTDEQLLERFADVGPVKHAYCLRDKLTHRAKYGFVKFAIREDAQVAVDTLSGALLNGKKMMVENAVERGAEGVDKSAIAQAKTQRRNERATARQQERESKLRTVVLWAPRGSNSQQDDGSGSDSDSGSDSSSSSSSSSSSEDEDSDSEGEDRDEKTAVVTPVAPVGAPKKVQAVPAVIEKTLSKKELKAKELAELDALLAAEMAQLAATDAKAQADAQAAAQAEKEANGAVVVAAAGAADASTATEADSAEANALAFLGIGGSGAGGEGGGGGAAKNKKKKKKKKAAGGSSVAGAKTQASKKPAKKSSVSAALAAARAAKAGKSKDKKKKKDKDKQKFPKK